MTVNFSEKVQNCRQGQMTSKKLNFGDLAIHHTPKEKRNNMKFFDSAEMARGREGVEMTTQSAPHYPPEGIHSNKEDSLLNPDPVINSDDQSVNEPRKPSFGSLQVQPTTKEKRNGRKFFDSAEWAMNRGMDAEKLGPPPRFPIEGINQTKDDSILNAKL